MTIIETIIAISQGIILILLTYLTQLLFADNLIDKIINLKKNIKDYLNNK